MNNQPDADDLKKRINKFSDDTINKKNKDARGNVSFGFRIGIEIVSAIAVGVAIGILVDKYLQTKPFGLIIFFILGSMAGFLNVYRVMRRIEKDSNSNKNG
ncbi:MAG: hypothetical protein CFH21_00068 [Alphaproteobacteria bacterium MarineAlpha5_Bin11]|nr:MAG: hypothetical protein CFH21_00068 [Alphaproteobacteria bacterium MarineAlpha5_Bin11]PPR52220.1 MAG: hypothetical protein CFH20_00125 [Alphaproteobacteria bacterium MarineAlpha5_Bin10]|tara:strand:- start:117 stop:419 length:303 start_codon:yes stop_codon:yes gene_type:complete